MASDQTECPRQVMDYWEYGAVTIVIKFGAFLEYKLVGV